MSFNNLYRGKKVIITGNTGFKGSWLSTWLLQLGADVYGISKDITTQPAMFEVLGLEQQIQHHFADIRDGAVLNQLFQKIKPDFVFHLAAQAIVSTSYANPIETFSTNVLGTANVLEAFRHLDHPCIAVLITSDKAYDNVEWIWGYRENDRLGGKDIYSGSKGAAELVIKSYYHSFLADSAHLKIGIGRAGNVIGGGDWAANRIVVDCMKAWSNNEFVELRSPKATRPWQHVLEPLSGYLRLGQALYEDNNLHGEAFNFGPRAEVNQTVYDLTCDLARAWGYSDVNQAVRITGDIPFHEAGLLKLNCDKALAYLKWQAALSYGPMIEFIADWYVGFYKNSADMLKLTIEQIDAYQHAASLQGIEWAK
ncbi:MAG TPA: CDP-glucose 4,6-dehydratase [Saprospiraceae bacterium]|nr:CDP-glucose 4,6-dehydratase [Saprospiraceae bacterium]HMQ83897.1 CDP-glucose 4,6-dehydratase [Saprospiraceae bacterium]